MGIIPKGGVTTATPMEYMDWMPRSFCPSFYERGFAAGLDTKTLSTAQSTFLQSLAASNTDYTASQPDGKAMSQFAPITVAQAKKDFPEYADQITGLFPNDNQTILYRNKTTIIDNKQAVRDQILAGYVKEYAFEPEAISCKKAYALQAEFPNTYSEIKDLSTVETLKTYYDPGGYCIIKKNTQNYSSGGFGKFLKDNKDSFGTQASQPDKSTCRTAIDQYYNAMEKKFPGIQAYDLTEIKQYLRGCNSLKFLPNYRSKLNAIMSSNKKYSGAYGLNENVDLSKTIRKHLLEYKEEKKNFLVEKKIVKNRFNLILENLDNRPNKKKIFNSLISEIVILKRSGIDDKVISEQLGGFFDIIKGFFGGDDAGKNVMSGLGGSFVEFAVKFIMNAIGLNPSGPIARLFVTAVGNVGSFENIPKILTDCEFTAELLSKSIVEAMAGSFIDNNIGKGFLADAIRNVLTDVAFNKDIVKTFQSKISGKVCEIVGQLGDKVGEKTKDMKQKALS